MKNCLEILAVSILTIAPLTVIAQSNASSQLVPNAEIVHTFVDDEGKLYQQRRYQGIIPSIRDYLGTTPPSKKTKRAHITWVGFQQKELYSRIFVQTNRPSHFTLSKPDPLTIVVSFDNTRIPRMNERRDLVTHAFQTRVREIRPRNRGKKSELVIHLSEPAGYLYKQNGSYVFIDIER